MSLSIADLAWRTEEPTRDYLFTFFFESFPMAFIIDGLKFATETRGPANGRFSGFSTVAMNCYSVTVPKQVTEPITIPWAGEKVTWMGCDNTDKTVRCSFIDDQSGWSYQFWNMMKDINGGRRMQEGWGFWESAFNFGVGRVHTNKRQLLSYTSFRRALCLGCGPENSYRKDGNNFNLISVDLTYNASQECPPGHLKFRFAQNLLTDGYSPYNDSLSDYPYFSTTFNSPSQHKGYRSMAYPLQLTKTRLKADAAEGSTKESDYEEYLENEIKPPPWVS